MKRVLVAALLLGLGGCASMSRTLSYGSEMADAQPTYEGHAYRIYVHPKDDTLLLQPPILTAAGRGLVTGATFHLAQPGTAYDPWKRAAVAFLQPVGCEVMDVYPLGSDTATWEARFRCPSGVDIRKLVADQRPQLRAGAPLHL